MRGWWPGSLGARQVSYLFGGRGVPRAAAFHNFAAKQAEELAKLAHLEREAWEAWERSCGDAETTSEKIVLAEDGDQVVIPRGIPGEAVAPVLLKIIYR